MGEAKISLTLGQICDLAPSFRSEVRKLLIKPRKKRTEGSQDQTSQDQKMSEKLVLHQYI